MGHRADRKPRARCGDQRCAAGTNSGVSIYANTDCGNGSDTERKVGHSGLNSDELKGYVDASFCIGIGFHVGVEHGLSA